MVGILGAVSIVRTASLLFYSSDYYIWFEIKYYDYYYMDYILDTVVLSLLLFSLLHYCMGSSVTIVRVSVSVSVIT